MQFFGGSDISPSPPAPTAPGNNANMIYIFNRNGVCLLYKEWNRPLHTLNAHQDHKLMFGLLFSLKSLTAKMDPTKSVSPSRVHIFSFHCSKIIIFSFLNFPILFVCG
ncbi:Trafficking protein particle complex subunit 1 [Linum perenne]